MRDRSHPLELLRKAASGRAAAGVRRALVPRGPNLDGRARDGHARLEAALAEFTGAAGALVFSSGYLANLTVVTALAAVLGAPNDLLIVSDAGNHASLIDACRLSRARVIVTPHRDPDAVRKVLANRDEAAPPPRPGSRPNPT